MFQEGEPTYETIIFRHAEQKEAQKKGEAAVLPDEQHGLYVPRDLAEQEIRSDNGYSAHFSAACSVLAV